MKYLEKFRPFAAGIIVGVVMLFGICMCFTIPDSQGQPTGITTAFDQVMRTLSILPAKSSNGTNAFVVYAKANSNYFRIEPTNANINIRALGSGTLWTGVTAVIQFAGQGTQLNTGFLTNMTFKNGILVGGP